MSDWKPLNDVQWMNIVNHDHAYFGWDKEDAIHHAVKAAEAKLRELNNKQKVPEGWQLVPKTITPQMMREINLTGQFTAKALQVRYSAMLAAAPVQNEDSAPEKDCAYCKKDTCYKHDSDGELSQSHLIEWATATAVCELPAVDEVIRGFVDDPTGDNAICLVREVMAATKQPQDDMALAYGYLWHINSGIEVPHDSGFAGINTEYAACEARKILRDKLTHEQRGKGIEAARTAIAKKGGAA